MPVTSRTELKEYTLRALGHPLVEIDITDEAFDDRIDEAIAFFHEYYYDGADRFFYKHEVTQTDIDNGYVTLPDHIWGVNSLFNMSNSGSIQPNIFDLQYQLRQWDLRDLSSTSMIYYSQVMSHLSLLENQLTVQRQFRFNRNSGALHIDMDWSSRVVVGQFLLVDCYSILDPETNTRFYNNRQFKEYTIALTKKQWSMAYKKYEQIQLPGGVTIDGNTLYQEALQEIQEIEQDIINNQSPLGFVVG